MEFSITCECGACETVSEGSAGIDIPCRCGRILTVPSLEKLRLQAGLSPVPVAPQDHIAALVRNGTLPGTTCVTCGSGNGEPIPFVAVCERQQIVDLGHDVDTQQWRFMTYFFPMGFLFRLGRGESETEHVVYGRDTVVPVPLVLCPACQDAYLPGWLHVYAGIGALLLTVASLVLFWWSIEAALAMLGVAIFVAIAGMLLLHRKRTIERRLLSGVREYTELFQRFPQAFVTLERAT